MAFSNDNCPPSSVPCAPNFKLDSAIAVAPFKVNEEIAAPPVNEVAVDVVAPLPVTVARVSAYAVK